MTWIDKTKRRDRFVLELAAETLSRILDDKGYREPASQLAALATDLKVGEVSAMEFVDDVSSIVSARLEAESRDDGEAGR